MNDERRHKQENGANASSGMPLEAMLSAYLDDRESLDAGDIGRIETLLANDAEARQIYAELQSVVRELQHLEPVEAPRSYHLDAEMVGSPVLVQMTTSNAWYARHAGAVRWATAAAAVIFVFVLGADLVLNSILTNPSDSNDGALPANQAQINDDREMVEEEAGDGADDASGGATDLASPPQIETYGVADDDSADEESGDVPAEDGAGEAENSTMLDVTPDEISTPQVDLPGSEPISGDDSARTVEDLDEDAAEAEGFVLQEETTSDASGGDSDRRTWRIVEFSLAVALALLITAMVILPRMSRSPRWR